MAEDEVDLEEETTEEEVDPLEGLDDATRAIFDAQLAARAETAATAERTRLEAEFKDRQSGYTKRIQQGNRALEERFGLTLDSEGVPVFKDPAKFGQAALGLVGQAAPKQAAGDALDEPVDWSEDPDIISKKFARQAERTASAIVEAALKPLQERLEKAEAKSSAAFRPALSNVPELARSLLDGIGVGGLADHQDFDEVVRAAVKSNLDESLWDDPGSVQAIALMMGGQLAATSPERKTTRTEQSREARNADMYRQSVGATGASRGGGRAPNPELAERAEYEQFRKEFGVSDISYEQYKAMGVADANLDNFTRATARRGR